MWTVHGDTPWQVAVDALHAREDRATTTKCFWPNRFGRAYTAVATDQVGRQVSLSGGAGCESRRVTEQREDQDREPAETSDRQWMTRGAGGIGAAGFLADVGHEVPTVPLASLITGTLGAPASAFGLIEGISDGLAGAGRFVGGLLALG